MVAFRGEQTRCHDGIEGGRAVGFSLFAAEEHLDGCLAPRQTADMCGQNTIDAEFHRDCVFAGGGGSRLTSKRTVFETDFEVSSTAHSS
jgi:hypothetical protein